MRVLIVEDEQFMAEAIKESLRREAISADIVGDGDDALHQLTLVEYDIALLDRDIPGTHGDEVCRFIAETHPQTRVIMLTAARRMDQKVAGFELGADDYLLKPFEFPELLARMRALMRRQIATTPPVTEFGGIRLDPFRREVFRRNHFVRLSRKEFAVLEVLLRAGGGVVSAERLLEKAWDENADPFTNAVRVTISTLRKRLGDPPAIETLAGVGYRVIGAD